MYLPRTAAQCSGVLNMLSSAETLHFSNAIYIKRIGIYS